MKAPPHLADAFALQADACRQLGSPFMGQLCDLLATQRWPETRLRSRYFNWTGDIGPSGQSLPLRLAGGLHALALQGDVLAAVYPPKVMTADVLWAGVVDALSRQDAFLCDWVDSPPQTNEVRRAAVLIAAGQLLADRFHLPMRVSELGASGGLNLMWDRFALDIGGARFGRANSALRLTPDWVGPLPPDAEPTVVERRGVDLNPLNPRESDQQLRLLGYLWPDQPDRLKRTRAAIELSDATVDKADAIEWLAGRLGHKDGQLHLVYSTIAWQYFPADAQARGQAMFETAGAAATDSTPLAWLAVEHDAASPGAAITLRVWPGTCKINLGRMDFHGRWVKWKGWI